MLEATLGLIFSLPRLSIFWRAGLAAIAMGAVRGIDVEAAVDIGVDMACRGWRDLPLPQSLCKTCDLTKRVALADNGVRWTPRVDSGVDSANEGAE